MDPRRLQQQNNGRTQQDQTGDPDEWRPWTECIPWQPGCPFMRSPGQSGQPQHDQSGDPNEWRPWTECIPWQPGCPFMRSPGRSGQRQDNQHQHCAGRTDRRG